MKLDLDRPRVVIGLGLIFMDSNIGMIFVGTSVATRLSMDEVHRSKNALLEFMHLSDIN